MSALGRYRAVIGMVTASCFLAGAFAIHSHGNIWRALALLAIGIAGSIYVQASPYRRLVRFALPWQEDQPDLDERERALRGYAYEASYGLAVLLFAIVFMLFSVTVEFAATEHIFWFALAFLAIMQMLPTLTLECRGPAGTLIAEPDD